MILIVLFTVLIVILIVLARVAINAGIVAAICYWLLPVIDTYSPEPDLKECIVYGTILLLIGFAINTQSSYQKKD